VKRIRRGGKGGRKARKGLGRFVQWGGGVGGGCGVSLGRRGGGRDLGGGGRSAKKMRVSGGLFELHTKTLP